MFSAKLSRCLCFIPEGYKPIYTSKKQPVVKLWRNGAVLTPFWQIASNSFSLDQLYKGTKFATG